MVIDAAASGPMPDGIGSLFWREISKWLLGIHESTYSALATKLVAVNQYDCSVMASADPYILPNSNLHHSGSSGCSSGLSGSCVYK